MTNFIESQRSTYDPLPMTFRIRRGNAHRMTFSEELKKKIQADARSVLRIAQDAGVEQGSLSRFINSGGLDTKTLDKLLPELGLQVVSVEEARQPDYAFIGKAKAKPSAGGGSVEVCGEKEEVLAFRKEWLSRRTITSEANLVVMPVSGESMRPTLDNGDIILVDRGETAKTLIDGKVYVIGFADDIFVKRFRKAPGKLLFKGDNQDMSFQDLEIDLTIEQPEHFKVHGRVLWAGKEM